MIARAVRRPLGTVALWAALAAAGVWQLRQMPVLLVPDVAARTLAVRAAWPTATPEMVESAVTSRVETAARAVRGVVGVRSVSRRVPGGGAEAEVELELTSGASVPHVRLSIAERLRALAPELPAGMRLRLSAGVPRAMERWRQPLLELHLSGPHTVEGLTALARERVAPVLLSEPGVREVRLGEAVAPRRVVVPDRLRAAGRGFTTLDLAETIRRATAARRLLGTLEAMGGVPVFLLGSGASGTAGLGETPVGGAAVAATRLGDVAALRHGLVAGRSVYRVRGRTAVSLQVLAENDVRVDRLGSRLRRRLATLGSELPAGIELGVETDAGREWRAIAGEGAGRGALGLALVILVVLVALRRAADTAIVLLAATASVLGAVFVVGITGGSLDLFTLSGLFWGLGLVADNALVVADLAGRGGGGGPRSSRREAVAAARAASPALTAGTATTVGCLAAMATVRSELLPWLVPFGVAAALALLASLAAALTFVPALIALERSRDRPARDLVDQSRCRAGALRSLARRATAPLLTVLAARPRTALLVFHLVLALTGWLSHQEVRRLPGWDAPWEETKSVVVDLRLERGTDLEMMDAAAGALEARLSALGGLDYRTSVEPAWARITIPVGREGIGPGVGPLVMAEMVAAATEFDGVDVRVTGLGPGFRTPGTSRIDYALEVTGHRYEVTRALAQRLAARLEADRRVLDTDPLASDPWHRRGEQVERVVELDPVALAAVRTSAAEASHRLAPVFRSRFPAGELPVDSFRVVVETRSPRGVAERRPFGVRSAVADLPVAGDLPLRRIVRERTRRVPPRIDRVDARYRMVVTWRFTGPRALGDRLRDELLATIDPPDGYRVRRLREVDEREGVESALRRSALVAAVAIVLVAAAVLDSWRTALAALLVVPASIVGSLVALVAFDVALTPAAYAGMGLMLGVAVNGGILVAHRAGELGRGGSAAEAAVAGTLQRLSPVLATGASSIAGLLPWVLLPSEAGAELWTALGLASIGGVAAGTAAAVTLVPAGLALGPIARMRRR